MQISVDGGALCVEGNTFGNFTFTRSLFEAFSDFDSENKYSIYSFCSKPDWFPDRKNLVYKKIMPKIFWLSTRVSLAEMKSKNEIFLALNQAIPLYTRDKIISFAHGLSFYFYPQFYPDSYHALKDQLEPMVKKSNFVIVPSKRVRNEMQKLFPDYPNFKVLNYGIPPTMMKHEPLKRKKFFLFVGMNNKIKNVNFIIEVFKNFKKNKKYQDFHLYLVGNLESYEDEKNGIFVFDDLSRDEIRVMYSEATAYLAASHYESFNFPVLEALSQNCPVIGLSGAIIPELIDYVFIANSQYEFENYMFVAAQNKVNTKYREIVIRKFSWQKYIDKLKDLYIQ